MGVIENAIEKLRRSGASASTGTTGKFARPAEHRSWASDAEPKNVSTRIVEIDKARLQAAGYLPEAGQEFRFADYYQQIKRPVIRRVLGPNATPEQRLIMITSALPGDGKTFTSMNLALSMARERDMSVLLVDADFPKAHIGRALDVHNELGLLDAAADADQDVESFVLRTNVPGLELLPGGRWTGEASELVSSARMIEVTARLTARNPRRLVLFDAAPLLVAGDSRALCHVVGTLLMVTRAGYTPRHALLEAVAQIDKNKLQGLVLNDAYTTISNSYYGYPEYGAAAQEARQRGD
jgi:Mrp family chromosome partitioning ATPase